MGSTYGHTVKAFDDDLRELRGLIAQMGGMAEAAIGDAMDALVRRDGDEAARIVEGDKQLDALELEIERQVVRLIALRAPMADDLREVLAALKISGVIERMGDYAKNIAKRVPMLQQRRLEPLSVLPAMARIVSEMVHDVLDSFATKDPELAVQVCQRDRAVDDFYNSLFRTLLTYMLENPHTITDAAHLLFIAKNLERIGDHATNIAEMVYFAATGTQMIERPRGEDPFAESLG